jgi:hypothetical protein
MSGTKKVRLEVRVKSVASLEWITVIPCEAENDS